MTANNLMLDPAPSSAHRVSHESRREQERIESLMSMLPSDRRSVLDIGARDGFITAKIAQRGHGVTALDLTRPNITAPGIRCVQGNAACLPFKDGTFDLVFCAEVLEHIPSPALEAAGREMVRVSRSQLLVGVPYCQDIRLDRPRCRACGHINPPWGHVNSFNQDRLLRLFPGTSVERRSFVGTADPGTNALSAWLMDRAGNPYGTYAQGEPCVRCGAALIAPPSRTPAQRALTRLAVWSRALHVPFMQRHANWIHVLLRKTGTN